MTATIRISAIKVGTRHRKALGEIRSLARSIEEVCIRSVASTAQAISGSSRLEKRHEEGLAP